MAKTTESGGTSAASSSLFVRPVTQEEMEAAEAAFPYIRMDGPLGEWVARMLSEGVKKVDILAAMEKGRVPGMQGDD